MGFRELEQQELQDLSKPIANDGSAVYRSRAAIEEISGIPVLSDFGQMREANLTNNDWTMPDLYRAPEVLLGLPWSFPVDIWSLGVMVRIFLPRSREALIVASDT